MQILRQWQVVAVAVLAVLTIAVLLTPAQPTAVSSDRPPPTLPQAATSIPAAHDRVLEDDGTGASSATVLVNSAALPPGSPFTIRGGGTFAVVPGNRPPVTAGSTVRYSVSLESEVSDIDPAIFAARVFDELSNPRGWAHSGRAFEQVDSGPVDWQVTLASPMTVRALCGYEIPVETSCWEPTTRRVVINLARWVRGSAAYIGDVDLYRTYMLNHEIAHALGHEHAHQCLVSGRAPVMMQQTIGTRSTTGQLCQSNPWPFPVDSTDAPGAEQPDTDQNNEYALIAP